MLIGVNLTFIHLLLTELCNNNTQIIGFKTSSIHNNSTIKVCSHRQDAINYTSLCVFLKEELTFVSLVLLKAIPPATPSTSTNSRE